LIIGKTEPLAKRAQYSRGIAIGIAEYLG